MRFYYNPTLDEETNFINLDVEHIQTFFTSAADDSFKYPFIEFLKSQNFDLGVGGLYNADSLLFRALGINYIKITPEDVESYTMQFKLWMPVQLSAYPSIQTYSNFDYDDLPHQDSQAYRWQMCKGYQYNRFWSRFKYYGKIKAVLPADLHQPLWDSFDQDHAMFIAEGTKAGIYQSIMMKPPNLQPVYPLRREQPELKTFISFEAAKN